MRASWCRWLGLCTSQACSLSGRLATDVPRLVQVLLGSGGSLWTASLAVRQPTAGTGGHCRWLLMHVLRGVEVSRRTSRASAMGAQGACGTWGHLGVASEGSGKVHSSHRRPLQVPAAAVPARSRTGSAPAAPWPGWCPGGLGHLEAPWCGVWGGEEAHKCLCQPLGWGCRRIGASPR